MRDDIQFLEVIHNTLKSFSFVLLYFNEIIVIFLHLNFELYQTELHSMHCEPRSYHHILSQNCSLPRPQTQYTGLVKLVSIS